MTNEVNLKQATGSLLDWARSEKGRDALKTGEVVRMVVIALKTESPVEGSGQLIGRLGDLGFQPGEPIAVLGRAPLGEPLFIEVRETVLALRFEEAGYLLIKSEEADSK